MSTTQLISLYPYDPIIIDTEIPTTFGGPRIDVIQTDQPALL